MTRFGWLLLPLIAVAANLACGPAAPTSKPVVPASSDALHSSSTAEPALRPAAGMPWFVDKSSGSGIDLIYRNGEEANNYAILESLGGGVGLLDYDRDGLLDVYVTGGGYFDDEHGIHGHPCRLYRNQGNWKFRDVSEETGALLASFYSHGVAVGDLDADGWPDLLITGYGRMALLHNVQGKFEEVTGAAGLVDPGPLHWSTSAAWGDVNNDGKLDLFVPHYVDWSFENHPRCKGYIAAQEVDVCPPEKFQPLPPALYINEGDGKFRLAADAGLEPGKALGAVLVDLTSDGRLDIYVTNDGVANQFYRNLGDGKFEECAASLGLAYDSEGTANGSMGVDVGDVEGNGKLAIFVANYENEMHCLYRDLGKGFFQCVSRPTGITAIGKSYVGFGSGFCDFDHDGALDLLVSNGHVIRHPARGERRQRPVVFHNLHAPGTTQPLRFAVATDNAGTYFKQGHIGRGVALGDLDNDGRVDLVMNNIGEPITLLRNEISNKNRWLGIECVPLGPKSSMGSVVTLKTGKFTSTSPIKGNGSYLSSSDLRLVFGLGTDDGPVAVTVRWPDGSQETWQDSQLPRNQYVPIEQRAVAAERRRGI